MKAKSLKIQAEDYYNDKVKDIEILNKSVIELENFDDTLIDKLYNEGTLPIEQMSLETPPDINEYFILKSSKASVLGRYDGALKRMVRVEKKVAYGIKPRNAEQTFSLDALCNPDIKLVALTGKAGTGKTLLALAAALEQHKSFGQILLARPIVALSNRDLGFLPGDAQEKINPYMQPLFDNLSVIKHSYNPRSLEYQKIEEMLKEEKLVITPLAYIRGRSLSDSYFIIDEAQNLTPHEIKTIITRAGEGTKLVFTGDLQQIDSPYLDMKSNGLAYMTEKMKNHEIFAHVNLLKGERSYLAELASDLL
jgi:PhoH-like ATPase